MKKTLFHCDHTVSDHESVLNFLNDLTLDLYFSEVEGKKPVREITLDRLDKWSKLRESLEKCLGNPFVVEKSRHQLVIDYADALVRDVTLKVEGRTQEVVNPVTLARIHEWYDVKHDLELCRRPLIHY